MDAALYDTGTGHCVNVLLLPTVQWPLLCTTVPTCTAWPFMHGCLCCVVIYMKHFARRLTCINWHVLVSRSSMGSRQYHTGDMYLVAQTRCCYVSTCFRVVFVGTCVTCVWLCLVRMPVSCGSIASVYCTILFKLAMDVLPYFGIKFL